MQVILNVTRSIIDILVSILVSLDKVVSLVYEVGFRRPVRGVIYYLCKHAYTLADLFRVVLPILVMKYLGIRTSLLLMYLFILFILYVIKQIAIEKRCVHNSIPVPIKRFTEESNGEVSIDNNRLEELLLYVADVEDFLVRTGRL